jgi:phosphatidyl-myo-inositol dimannoside synthase
LTPDFPPAVGGIQLLMHRLVSNLGEVDARVITLGSPGAGAFDAEQTFEVVRVARKGGRRNRMSVARLNAAGIRRGGRFAPTGIVSGHAVTAPAAAALHRLRATPVIQYVHGDEFRTRPRLVRFAVRRADAVVAVSGHAGDMAIAAGCDPDRVHVVHPGVESARADAKRSGDRPIVLTVARLSAAYKGHDVMMSAMPLIRARVPEVEWVIVGDGPLRAQLQRRASAEGVEDAVCFVGSVSDEQRDAWLARASVFAMPSRLPPEGIGGEGFGIVYLEAAAHRLPVVAGAVGGALDAVIDGQTGHLVDPGDPAAVANAVADLLLDPEKAAALGEAGAARATHFTWERHAGTVRRLMREVGADR